MSIAVEAAHTDRIEPPASTRQPEHDEAAPPTRDRGPGRDPFLDNAKFLAVVLVVVGHVWNNLRMLHGIEAGYLCIYLFHIPALVLVTGHLSRSGTELTSRRVQGIVATVVVPYVLFQLPYGPLADLAMIDASQPGLVSPAWLMWFLPALACWRLTAGVWRRMRAPVAVAVAVSLLGGATSEPALGLTEVLGLLPFFVLGLCLRPRHLDLLRTRAARLAAVVVLAAAVVACYLVTPMSDPRMEWIYWRSSYAQLGASWMEGGLVRLGLLAAGVLLAAAFLALVPRRRTWFTALGRNTMYGYLLHGFVILLALAFGVFDLPVAQTVPGAALVTVTAVLVACGLMSPPVQRAARPVVQPDLGWLWRR